MAKSINFNTFKNIGALLILSALMVAILIPAGASAAEGKKGLNAVNVKVLSKDSDEPMPEWVKEHIVGREMVMPGDNVRAGLGDDLESPWHSRAKGIIDDNWVDELGNTWEELVGSWFETCSRETDKRTVVVCMQEAFRAAVIPMFQDQHEKAGSKGEGTFTLIRSIGNTGGGTFTLIKRAGEAPDIDIEIEIPESKGTVKFFNESKSFGRGVANIVIKTNGIPTGHRGHSR